MRTSFITLVCLATLLAACADVSVDGPAAGDDADLLGTADLAIKDGTPEAIGVLALLNDPRTSLRVLDEEARLNSRAAKALIHYRDGYDGAPGTSDDNLFENLAEIDAVRNVGPAAIAQLLNFATLRGWVPKGDDELGRWDGVPFTVSEAERTLVWVNRASHDLIDHDLRMDKRTADSVINAQPVASIEELAGLYYVGKSALLRFKAEALAVPEGYAARFEYANARQIPAGNNYGTTSGVLVTGVPDVIAGVYVAVDVHHSVPSELRFELTDAQGNGWEFEGTGQSMKLPLGAMKAANGRWTLTVSDPTPANSGLILKWAVVVDTLDVVDAARGRCALDLSWALGNWYRAYGNDVQAMGGNTLAEARAAISAGAVTEVTDPQDDPEGYDLATTLVLRHPDVVFPGSDRVWYAAYDRESGTLSDVYSFE